LKSTVYSAKVVVRSTVSKGVKVLPSVGSDNVPITMSWLAVLLRPEKRNQCVPASKLDKTGETKMMFDDDDESELYRLTPFGLEELVVVVVIVAKEFAPLSNILPQHSGKFGVVVESKFSFKAETASHSVVNV